MDVSTALWYNSLFISKNSGISCISNSGTKQRSKEANYCQQKQHHTHPSNNHHCWPVAEDSGVRSHVAVAIAQKLERQKLAIVLRNEWKGFFNLGVDDVRVWPSGVIHKVFFILCISKSLLADPLWAKLDNGWSKKTNEESCQSSIIQDSEQVRHCHSHEDGQEWCYQLH